MSHKASSQKKALPGDNLRNDSYDITSAGAFVDGVDMDESCNNGTRERPDNLHHLRRQIDSLHQEMEVAQYGTDLTGYNFRKRLSKKQMSMRTRKRRSLEQQDMREQQESLAHVELESKRLRGSRASLEKEVIQGSLVILPKHIEEAQHLVDDGFIDQSLESDGGSEDRNIGSDDNDDAGEEEEDDDSLLERCDDEEVGDEADDSLHEAQLATESKQRTTNRKNEKRSKTGPTPQKRSRRKAPFRMRNFKSLKLAEQHGEALDAHTRGRHKDAIQKLKQIAREAPSAPQVYSSLGMVYYDMFRESNAPREENDQSEAAGVEEFSEQEESEDGEGGQLDLARRAYGAYHVAAILCKKDYELWVRAADLACEVADLHSAMLTRTNCTDIIRNHHKAERLRWLGEAKNDYQTADNLRPPGLDVPAKLATVLIELGHLSEALTLLTDLKNRESSGFGSSYKAWWLYASLMLRIGDECKLWSSGDESNKNYMFRRWLRKHSKTFDWKERRLQALIMALEAAAGSENAGALTKWLTSRVLESSVGTDSERKTESTDSPADQFDLTGEGMKADVFFERETALLEERNKSELAAFDKTSGEMLLEPGQKAHTLREDARTQLLRAQKKAMDELMDEVHQRGTTAMNDRDQDGVSPSPVDRDVSQNIVMPHSAGSPISASFVTVTKIALELLSLTLEMGIYGCGAIVGQTVASYMKRRAEIHSSRLRLNEGTPSPMFPELLTTDSSGYSSDSDESHARFSDDEDFDSNPTMLSHLQMGILPPEVRILIGCCLVGKGGADFLAFRHLESLKDVYQSRLSSMFETLTTKRSRSERAMNPVSFGDQTSGFAFVAAFLRRVGKTSHLATWLLPLFDVHADMLISTGLLDSALQVQRNAGSRNEMSLNIIEVVFTSVVFTLETVTVISKKEKSHELKIALDKAFGRLVRLFKALWTVEDDSSVSFELVRLIEALERAANLYVELFAGSGGITQIFDEFLEVVTAFCRHSSSEDLTKGSSTACKMNHGMISADFLSKGLERLALLSYNLGVAMNVTFFSGWELEQFRLSLLRRRVGANHFGVTINCGLVSGALANDIEEMLSNQWRLLSSSSELPNEICTKLDRVRGSDKYKDVKEANELASTEHKIAQFGEESALRILLHFSEICLQRKRCTSEGNHAERLHSIALSIILPLTQFCIGERLWDSEIGTIDEASIHRKLDIGTLLESLGKKESVDATAKKKTPYDRRSRRTHIVAQSDIASINERPSTSQYIIISSSRFMDAWNMSRPTPRRKRGCGDNLMASVIESMHALRRCASEAAIEKASLSVAVSLLNVAAESQNPFLCLEQAARFANKAPKRGTSDLAFQSRLPELNECSPLDALVILGRADCLQAVHFCEEAAFLCNFVATLCRHQRNFPVECAGDSQKWKLVSVKVANVFLAVRLTAASITIEMEKLPDYIALHEEVVLGRKFASALQQPSSKILEGCAGADHIALEDRASGESDLRAEDDVMSFSEAQSSKVAWV